MDKFESILQKARSSAFYLWLLNTGMWKKIPFNKPHRFRITDITDEGFEITMPYIKKNMNHLKGMHACGLATVSEYVAGLTLLRKVGAVNYRLIMETLSMKYHYQAKQEVVAKFGLSDEWIGEHVKRPLEASDAVFVELSVDLYDRSGNHISTGTTRWQVKKWDKVRTKV